MAKTPLSRMRNKSNAISIMKSSIAVMAHDSWLKGGGF